MIDKIDIDNIGSEDSATYISNIESHLNDYEVTVINKINEIIEKFNEVFPL